MTAATIVFRRIALFAGLSLGSWGSDFSFFTTMRAGYPDTFAWDIGAGSTSATTEARSNYEWNPSDSLPHWRSGDLPQNFQIGYNRSTDTGFVRIFNVNNTAFTASFANPGSPVDPASVWTLPAASFFATATSLGGPSSVNVASMTFSPGVQILSGSLPASLGANYSGAGAAVTNTASAPIVFNAASSGGTWTISGTVRFNGLWPISGNALNDQLRFGVGASALFLTPTPETSPAFLIGGGLIALGCIRQRRLARRTSEKAQPS